jgi:hypothetical protein
MTEAGTRPEGTRATPGDGAIDVKAYTPTDPFFGPAHIDHDEARETPIPHRYVHGGFEGTETRFAFSFPTDGSYHGRILQPLEGAHGGHEHAFANDLMGDAIGGLRLCARLGGCMVESNQGHIGDDLDPKAGEDATLYGHRASAETARLAKFVAAQAYGQPPHHSYVWGGSGGGRRSPLCLENAPDAWDGALPFVGGGPIVDHGNTDKIKGAQTMAFASMFNCQRLLGDKIGAIADAMAPGGHGDPFVGLDTHQREELARLYRLGFPRGDEYMIGQPLGQMWLWTSMADSLVEQDPGYFDAFWTTPGYMGYDHPELLEPYVIDTQVTVTHVLTGNDILTDPRFDAPEHQNFRMIVSVFASLGDQFDTPLCVELEGVGPGYRLGAGVHALAGPVAGRPLYCAAVAGDIFYCDGVGDANLRRFEGLLPGDEVRVDNRKFLAFHYFARHHLMDDPEFDSMRVDSVPVYQQHPVPLQSALMGVGYSGQYAGKLIWVHHTKDSSLWPPQGIVYRNAVLRAQGEEGARERFRLRWTENAEHGPSAMVPSLPNRAASTWLIDYMPVIEQSLADLIDWVEHGVDPVDTAFEFADGKVLLSPDAGERRGIQPVVAVTANGAVRAEVAVGEPVSLELRATVPPGAGTIIHADWDFDGTGTFPFEHSDVDGSAASVVLSTTHAFEQAGEYFVTGRVHSHRAGDVSATSCRVPNLAQARVVVS